MAFGRFAGMAGMIDMLRGLGERYLSLGAHCACGRRRRRRRWLSVSRPGFSTPFLGVSSSYSYPSLEQAKLAVSRVGEQIARVGLPTVMVRALRCADTAAPARHP